MSLDSLKRSRSAHIRVVTKERNRHQEMESSDPSTFEISKFKDKLKCMEAKREEFDTMQNLIWGYGPERIDLEEEQSVADQFEDNLDDTCTLLRRLISLNQVCRALRNLRKDLEALARSRDEMPNKDHSSVIQCHHTSFKELRALLDQSTIQPDHEYHDEVEQLQDRLSSLSIEERPIPAAASAILSAAPPSRARAVHLPKITLPHFSGNIMSWTTFWTQFSSVIDSNPDLSQANKLTYLRDAIRDPTINPILYSGVKSENHYDQVIKTLQERFDKKRIIHSNYCKRLIDTTTIKNTRVDLTSFADSLAHTVLGLKSTDQYDMDSCITSLAVQLLPKHLQVQWEVHT